MENERKAKKRKETATNNEERNLVMTRQARR
jgi:hypothetical protein